MNKLQKKIYVRLFLIYLLEKQTHLLKVLMHCKMTGAEAVSGTVSATVDMISYRIVFILKEVIFFNGCQTIDEMHSLENSLDNFWGWKQVSI